MLWLVPLWHQVHMCVLMSGSELKTSLPVSRMVALGQWQHLTVECITQNLLVLCSWSLSVSEPELCVCDMTDILVFTSASQPPWSTCCTLMQVCGAVFERATKPQNSAQETERLIEAELSECFLGNIRHTQSDQTSIHQHHHPNLALAVLLARGTPIISLTRWGWHVKWGCMARRCFVVYHRLKLQVLQLVWLSGTDGCVCVSEMPQCSSCKAVWWQACWLKKCLWHGVRRELRLQWAAD